MSALPLLWLVMRTHTTCKASSPSSKTLIHAPLLPIGSVTPFDSKAARDGEQ